MRYMFGRGDNMINFLLILFLTTFTKAESSFEHELLPDDDHSITLKNCRDDDKKTLLASFFMEDGKLKIQAIMQNEYKNNSYGSVYSPTFEFKNNVPFNLQDGQKTISANSKQTPVKLTSSEFIRTIYVNISKNKDSPYLTYAFHDSTGKTDFTPLFMYVNTVRENDSLFYEFEFKLGQCASSKK